MKGIRSPGRKAMAQTLKGRMAEGLFYHMQGAPEAVEQDKQFYALFGEWARKGRTDKQLEARMRARWNEVMREHADRSRNNAA